MNDNSERRIIRDKAFFETQNLYIKVYGGPNIADRDNRNSIFNDGFICHDRMTLQPLGEGLFDFTNGFARVQTFRACVGAVHDRVTAI